MSLRTELIDWRFVQDHPLLWEFEDDETMYVNGPIRAHAVFEYLLSLGLPEVSERDLRNHIELPPDGVAPAAITLPTRLREPMLAVLHDLDVPVVMSPASVPAARVVLLLDEDDYVVADDFVLDVPDFVHEDRWFRPGI